MSALTAAEFLTAEERTRVEEAIADAERLTSGELRVHLEDHIEEEALDHAAFIFEELAMHRTRDRNAVLLYICVADRQVAVIGDSGIHARVGNGFWSDVVAVLKLHFAADQRCEGLCEAVRMIGEKLRVHFPLRSDDTNELSNTVTYSTR
ncbi:MAG: TPM domain-containing protein [Flavobacteriales bacterium]